MIELKIWINISLYIIYFSVLLNIIKAYLLYFITTFSIFTIIIYIFLILTLSFDYSLSIFINRSKRCEYMVFSLKFAINKITIKAKKDLTLQFTQEDCNFQFVVHFIMHCVSTKFSDHWIFPRYEKVFPIEKIKNYRVVISKGGFKEPEQW